MARDSSDTVRRAGLLAVAVALAAATSAALARLRRRTGDRSTRDDTYTCRCGTSYRVSGTDRHRVYWTADAPEAEPVLGDRCVECDASLPAGTRPARVESR